ncbi:MAG: hypothetical protein CTY35_00680 [Methylotenera sp.]|uniref:hypothetical protein n=1 Tax=Methylotenera sp. TaxID=2051956 RepID=UPI000D4AB5A9|nr:hypothetical protein [Methylotenera sp.]PPC84869.1 MAG: hypothetical protein CTY38_00675 [Methylotenera sp.]PPD02229.1 MAG: hypothetical protein CTY35_00680 [Methylotenera sp.]
MSNEATALTNSELEHVRKSVFAIHIIPTSGSLNVQSRKIQVHLAKTAGEQYRKLPIEIREQIESAITTYTENFRNGVTSETPAILLQPRFSMPIKKLAEEIGYDVDSARKLTAYLDQLQVTQVKFNALMHNAAKTEETVYPSEVNVVTSLISSYMKSGKMISWAYDPVILSIMVNPRTYAQLNLNLVRNARTYSALALYENTKRFLHIERAGPYDIKVWQALLAEDGVVPDWEDASEFRRKLRRALAELKACEACDIDLEPIESRDPQTNKRTLEFIVSPRRQFVHDFGDNVPKNHDLFTWMISLGIKEPKVRSMMDAYPEDLLMQKKEMFTRKIKSDPTIRNQAGWFIEAVQNDYVEHQNKLDRHRKQKEFEDKLTLEKQKLSDEFNKFQINQVRLKYEALDEGHQEDLMQEMQFNTMSKSNVIKMPENLMLQKLYAYLKNKEGWLTESYELRLDDYIVFRSIENQR